MIFYLLGWMTKVDAGRIAAFIRKSSGVLLPAGGVLVFTRNPGLALLAGMLAYSVMARTGWYPGKGRSALANSAVRTPYLEMALDHATGAVSGRVLKGPFAGRALMGFSDAERMALLHELRSNDAQGAQLFEAYLDRAFPGWTAKGGGEGEPPGRAASGGMSVDQAYLVLGLKPGATREEVLSAHRNLMKRFHPDQGGSTYLASQVNEAKEVLLKRLKV